MHTHERPRRLPASHRLGHAASAGIALMVLAAGRAQGAAVAPLSPELCRDLGRKMSDAVRLEVTTSEGAAASVSDLAPAGTACLLTAHGAGLEQSFADAQGRLEKALDGWEQIPEIGAGGPDEMIQGFKKDDRRVVVSLQVEPPTGTCETVVEADCKVPRKRWQWTFKAAAYRE